MRLKDEFITQDLGDEQVMVAEGGDAFNGIVRSNETAAFIVDMLSEDVSEKDIVDAMCAKYDAPRSMIEEDVRSILDILRSINALEE